MREADGNPSLDSLQRIERLCSQFEHAWRADPQERIEDYLDRSPEPERPRLFHELIRLELELRRARGEAPRMESYLSRFPGYRRTIETTFHEGPGSSEPLATLADRTAEAMRTAGYEILETLGQGGMAVVYKARHARLDRLVALKVILAGIYARPEHLDRFRREALVVARFQHPNIVQVYEVGEADGLSFLALEYADGGSLEKRLAATPQSPRESARLIETLARAAHYAHEQGIVHRDLKPANVLLSSVPKIADFGLAKQLDSAQLQTHSGEIIGTVSYMAPEQATGKVHEISPATDVYALGAILYEMLTGRPPFKGATVVSTLEQVATQEPVAPSRLQRHVPRDLETVCLKCLEKEPPKRYGSAEALADDLRRFLQDEPIVARRTSVWERGWKWAKRRPVEAALSAAVLVVAVLGLLGIGWQWRDAVAARRVADRERDLARRELYRASIAAASSALRLHNSLAAGNRLEASPEEYRNWEWRHFQSQLENMAMRLRGHEAPVRGATFSPDGSRILSFSEDRTLRLWEAGTGKLLSVIRGHTAPVWCASFSPDGARIASGAGAEFRLWDGTNGVLIAELRGHTTHLPTLSFSADGTRILTGEYARDPVYLWDASNGRKIAVVRHPGGTQIVAFSPDGTRFATGGKNSLRVWDTATRRELHVLRFLDGHVNALAFSPDGSRIVSGSGHPASKLRIWDVATGRLLGEMAGHQNAIDAVAFSPDGSRIASGSMDQTARLWDARTLQVVAVLRGHTRWVHRVQFSPNGKRLATASVGGTLRLWDAATGELISVLRGHGDAITSVAFSPDGSRVLSASGDGTLGVWDSAMLERNGTLRGHTSYVYDAAFSPDGTRVASASWDGTLRVWDAASGESLASLDDDSSGVLTLAFDLDGRRIASGSREGTLKVWDTSTGEPRLSLKMPCSTVDSIAVSPDGKQIAAALGHTRVEPMLDRRLWLIDMDTGALQVVLRGHTRDVASVRFSPDGKRIASGGGDGTVRVWDARSGESVAVLAGHSERVRTVAFNPAGTLIASGSEDRSIRLWDARSFRGAATLLQASIVYSIAFSPDGTRLVAGCSDNTIRLWDVSTREEVAQLDGHEAYVHSVAFSPDGTRIVSGSGDTTVRIWDTLPPHLCARRR